MPFFATTSLALASVVLALGSGRTGFPKEVSERRKAGGSWTPPRHMRPEAYVATRAAQIIKGEDQRLRKIVSGSPTGQPPAPKLRSARERRRGFAMAVAEASAVAQKVASGSPTSQLPAPKLRKRARATRPSEAVAEASAVAQKIFSGSPTGPTPASKRRERAFGQPDGPDPSPNLR